MEQLDERKRTPEVGGRTQDVRGSRRFHGVLYGFTAVSQYFFIWKSWMEYIYIYIYIYIVQYGFHTIDMGRFMVSFRFLIGLLDCDWFQCFFATTPANIGP